MDNRPIGLFDSGVGGLSAVAALRREAPGESFVYFGDTARVPYGDREPAEICAFARQDARFLRTQNVKALIIACNTITATALPQLTADHRDLPVIGVIAPAAVAAVHASRSGKIGLIATSATVKSGVYERAIRAIRPDAAVTAQGCPALVPLIEAGHTAPTDSLLLPPLRQALAPLTEAGVDTVILGCTHFPLIAGAVAALMGPEIALVDSGAACIGTALAALAQRDALSGLGEGQAAFYCSARPADFASVATAFLGADIRPLTHEIDISAF